MIEFNGEEYLDTNEAAKFLLITPRALARLRAKGTGPPYTRYIGRIYYRSEDLFSWMDAELERNRVS